MNIYPKSSNFFFLLNVVLPLVLGGLIYILFRGEEILMFYVFDWLGLSHFVQQLRTLFATSRQYLPEWVIFSLPNALWLYSMLSFWAEVWKNNFKVAKLLMYSSVVLSLLLELLQIKHWIPGTYSCVDIFFILISFFVFLLSHPIIINLKKNE